MKPYDPNEPVIFTHIPKCAGSSFIRLLIRWFGPEYLKLNQDERQDILLPRHELKDANGNWVDGIKVVHGHFDHGRKYGLPYYYPEVNQYFTIFRDPFDIVVSMYFFCKGRSKEGKYWYRGEQVNILDEYPTLQSYLADYPYWLFNHLPQDITLSNYRDKIESQFIYIGIQEDLPGSIRQLAELFKKPIVELPHFNKSVYDEVVPDGLRDRFYRDYPLLKAIYDYAKENYLRPLPPPLKWRRPNLPQN
ncbi:MAG TPA: sulfotransferase family 2 domain-containing protein [Pirellulaceae bacterium]|nr:sulfotransferase family 2 domain-containing protein [Pirellulaceae bacterium]HMO93985.1 sulfotransferase family 2 domain-containing protein [Pirellulaceae bacterium]HMP70859.1 sulfotransferase family 2 domain-containing protein [Pirellulaceae bacterium]